MNNKLMEPLNVFGLKNFRVFDDKHGFLEDFSPITILTGANSSGKSSVIKALQMLKSSIKRKQFPFDLDLKEQGHLLGDFNDILYRNDNRNIVVSLPFTFLGIKSVYVSLSFIVPTSSDAYSGKLRKIEVVDKEDDSILFSFAYREATDTEKEAEREDYKSKMEEYERKSKEEPPEGVTEMLYRLSLIRPSDSILVAYVDWEINKPKLKNYLEETLGFYKIYQDNKRKRDFLEKMDEVAEKINFAPSILINSFKNDVDITTWEAFIESELNEQSIATGKAPIVEDDFISEDFFYAPPEIEDILYDQALRILAKQLPWENPEKRTGTYSVLEECFRSTWKRMIQRISETNYVSTIKEANSRAYLGTSDSAFINLLKDYRALDLNSSFFFINKYLKEFEIGKSIEVDYDLKYQLIKIFIVGPDDVKRELVDYGYGIKQLIIILIQISVLAENSKDESFDYDDDGNECIKRYYNPSLLLIEEPETNLHPKWQSLLAVMFEEANREFKIQMIIETHSEYLIRKFQTLVAAKDLDNDNIKIFYLRGLSNTSGKKQVETILIQQDGSINYQAFDKGFFDESDNLEFSLLNFQREKFLSDFEALKVSKKQDEDKIIDLGAKIDEFTNKLDLSRYQNAVSIQFNTSKLSNHSADYLASAQFMLSTATDNGGDYSPVILQYGRTVENELKELFKIIAPYHSYNLGQMQGALERFKGITTTMPSCTASDYSLLIAELPNQFNSPLNVKIELINDIRNIRNSAAHPGQTKSRADALSYITIVNDFLQSWITEKK